MFGGSFFQSIFIKIPKQNIFSIAVFSLFFVYVAIKKQIRIHHEEVAGNILL